MRSLGALVAAVVLAWTGSAYAQEIDELFEKLQSGDIVSAREAESEIVAYANDLSADKRKALVERILQGLVVEEGASAAAYARVLGNLKEPWRVENETTWVETIYKRYGEELEEDIREDLDDALMNAQGLFRSGLAENIADAESAAKAIEYFGATVKFRESGYSARAQILIAQTYLKMWELTRGKEKLEALAQALGAYSTLLDGDLLRVSRGGWRWRADAMFQRALTKIVAGNMSGAVVDLEQLQEWPPEKQRTRAEISDSERAVISDEYVDQIFVFRFVPGVSKIHKRHFETRHLAGYVLKYLRDKLEEFEPPRPMNEKEVSSFLSYLDQAENLDNTLIVGSFTSEVEARVMAKKYEDKLNDTGQMIDIVQKLGRRIEFSILRPERGSAWGVKVEGKLSDSEVGILRAVFGRARIGKRPWVMRPPVE